jgi:hypothetical protein
MKDKSKCMYASLVPFLKHQQPLGTTVLKFLLSEFSNDSFVAILFMFIIFLSLLQFFFIFFIQYWGLYMIDGGRNERLLIYRCVWGPWVSALRKAWRKSNFGIWTPLCRLGSHWSQLCCAFTEPAHAFRNKVERRMLISMAFERFILQTSFNDSKLH